MRAWNADGLPSAPHRETVLYAIRRHDDGWIQEDRVPQVDADSGRMIDFMDVSNEVRLRLWPRGVAALAASPYAAALVAEHALRLHERHRADPLWETFFHNIEDARDRYLAASAPLDARDLGRDYFFVRLGDLLSLIFCSDWRELHSDSQYEARFDGARLQITPDPFNGRQVPLQVSARQLPNRRFHTSGEASEALAAAPLVTLTGVATGP